MIMSGPTMSDSLKDYATSTVGTAIQRIKNPAFGAFSLSWCAFNWKQLLYLFLSNTSVLDKIEYISTHSTWKTVIGYPVLSSIIICGFVPWANLMISKWQVKPLDNTDSINNLREAKILQRSTRLQRLKAKRDITYQKVTTGEEKVIQDMKEEIIKSKENMGELTAELTAKDEQLHKFSNSLIQERKETKELNEKLNKLTDDFNTLAADYSSLKAECDALMIERDVYKSRLSTIETNPENGGFNQLKGLQLGEVATNLLNGQNYKNAFIFDKKYDDHPIVKPNTKNPKQ